MALIAKDSGDFITVTPGNHLGRCYRIIDLGTQKSEYMGKTKYQPKVMIQFEVHGEDEEGKPLVTQDGRPLSIAKSYTRTLTEMSSLRKDLEMWRNREFTAQELRGFELKNILGQWAMLTVVQAESNGKTYTNIAAITSPPKALRDVGFPDGVNEIQIFDIDDPDMKMFDSFSENLKNKITSSPEWQSRSPKSPAPVFDSTGLDDTPPF